MGKAKMKFTKAILAAALLLLPATVARADDAAPAAPAAEEETGPFAKQNFTGTLWWTTDYMFRGISNTRNHPAVQGEMDWTYEGFYLSGWMSNTEFQTAHLETDGYFGYRFNAGMFAFDFGGLYYGYPGGRNLAANAQGKFTDVDYWEGKAAVSTTLDMDLSPAFGLQVYISPDFSGNDGTAEAVYGTFGLALPYGINFSSGVGYQNVSGDQSSGTSQGIVKPDGTILDGYDYVWWNAGVNTDYKGFHFDLSYYDTAHTADLKVFNGGSDTLFHGRAVFTLSKAF